MATFTYTARAFNGDLRTATIDAASRDDVIAQLRNSGSASSRSTRTRQENRPRRDQDPRRRHLHPSVLDDDQLGPAARAGADDSGGADREQGAGGSHARRWCSTSSPETPSPTRCRKHPQAFTNLYVNMVAAGEAGGILDTILMRLATFMEKNDALVRKVKGAMIYPAVIMSVAGIAVVVLLIFVIPVFEKCLRPPDMALPLPTRIVIGASGFLKGYWWMIGAVIIVGGYFVFKKYYATSNGKLVIDRLMLQACRFLATCSASRPCRASRVRLAR